MSQQERETFSKIGDKLLKAAQALNAADKELAELREDYGARLRSIDEFVHGKRADLAPIKADVWELMAQYASTLIE